MTFVMLFAAASGLLFACSLNRSLVVGRWKKPYTNEESIAAMQDQALGHVLLEVSIVLVAEKNGRFHFEADYGALDPCAPLFKKVKAEFSGLGKAHGVWEQGADVNLFVFTGENGEDPADVIIKGETLELMDGHGSVLRFTREK